MIEIVYETHARTTDNEAGTATGWNPGELSATGHEQARELGRRRTRDGIAAVFTSDLHRAVETAALAFAGTSIPIHHDARLRECDYGDLTGSPSALLPRARHIDVPFPGGQSYHDVLDATADFLRDLTGWEGHRLLVIAHTANRWALDCILAGADLKDLMAAPFEWQPGWEYRL